MRLGYEVKEAADGGAAVDFADSYKPDVILLDGRMPNMDGYEACRAIRDFNTSAIIIGMSMDNLPGKWKRAGADNFLYKPIFLENPQDTMRNYIDAAKRLK